MAKISIIIPIYNVEKYLRECLYSVINQTVKDIEIICINDGSSDNSLNIIEEFAEKDSRIKIINQDNHGIGYARNKGIEVSSADYIYFLDSDDYISNDFLEPMYNKAIENNADIVFNDNIISFDERNKNKTKQVIREKLDNGIYYIDSEFINKRYINPVVWSKLYKKSKITENNIYFPIGLISEDAYFYYALLPFLKKAVQINNGTYYYRERQGSLTHQKVKKYSYDSIRIFELIYNFYKKNNLLGKYTLPYRLIAYRSTQNGEYSKYRKEVLKMIDKLHLDINKMQEDYKLNLLLKSKNRLTYSFRKIFKKWGM